MAELDMRDAATGHLSYFGLMPEALGKRLGYFFLYHACMNAWTHPISKLLVNIPLPAIAGLQPRNLSIGSDSGYVMVKGQFD